MRLVEFERFGKADLKHELYVCNRCGFCRSVCPVYAVERWEGSTPRGRIYFTKKLVEGKIKEIHPKYVERVFQCAFCGQCDEVCQLDIDHVLLWRAMRAELGRRGLWPQSIEALRRSLEVEKNVFNVENSERNNWSWDVEDAVLSKFNKGARVAYFVGCVSSLSARMSDIPVSMVRIMDAAGVDYTLLGQDEWCCGDPLLLCILEPRGYQLADQLVNHNLERLHKLGVETLIASCAGCYRAFKKEYPDINKEISEFEVLHTSEFIERLIDSGKLRLTKKIENIATYHDPCELGRHSGVYEPPRKVLENIPGLKLNELIKSRGNCRCCGGGGLMEATNPQLAIKIAHNKLDEASEVGADVITSCCPACKMNLLNAITERERGMEVLDVAEVVASVL